MVSLLHTSLHFVASSDLLWNKCFIFSWSIERQAAEFYTEEIFERFQKMLSASACFFPLRAEREGICFNLVPNPGLDFKTYMVKVVAEDQLFTCACTAFEMCGLICPHIFE
jgi:hypothetical protein